MSDPFILDPIDPWPGDDIDHITRFNSEYLPLLSTILYEVSARAAWDGDDATKDEMNDKIEELIDLINTPYEIPAMNEIVRVIRFESSGVGGGSTTTNTWVTTPLNIMLRDDTGAAWLNNGVLVMPPGAWEFKGWCTVASGGAAYIRNELRINEGGSVIEIFGANTWLNGQSVQLPVFGKHVAVAEFGVQLRVLATAGHATYGLGYANPAGYPTTFAELDATKVG